MLAQINFKLPDQDKRRFEIACKRKGIVQAEFYRAIGKCLYRNEIPVSLMQKVIGYIESEPETRGRKPADTDKPRKVRYRTRKTNTAKRLLKKSA